jgi:aldehyde dehydrogenase (NAD+)
MEQQINAIYALQKSSLQRLKNASAASRIEKLRSIETYMLAHKQSLFDALYADFRKPSSEVIIAELLGVKKEINYMIKHLKSWMKPQKVGTPLMLMGTQGQIQLEPKGMCLIIAPWNYPFNLAINPLVHAIAAGNAIMLKPSEMSEHTSAFINIMITALFDSSEVAVFEGDASVASYLLEQKFDHIFFTGSPMIGKKVMEAASKHLCSVTLELGGKSPAIVDESADISSSAQKIAWGKFLNNGQTCIAPDYLYVHEKVNFQFLQALELSIASFYGTGSEIATSKDYARIVNKRHFNRIKHLVDEAVLQGAKILIGGDFDESTCFMSPTILTNCTIDMQIMQEEIFGPILPVMTFKNEVEITGYLSREEKPLALYIFSQNQIFSDFIVQNTSSGSCLINDCLIQFGHDELPFGGVNNSGIGKSGGKFGFLEFSHAKSVLVQRTNLVRYFYPPYTAKRKWLIEQVLKWF